MQTMAVPEVGQLAPEFRLKAHDGTYYSLSEYRGDKHVLLVFYPLAFSPVCSHQLPEVQAMLDRFEAADAVVFGISVDSHWANGAFARQLGLRFPLLSDWKREASAAIVSFHMPPSTKSACTKRIVSPSPNASIRRPSVQLSLV